ncbi:hypothetical protein BH11MYX3_BH11MYX3_20370 [soil metagenome]
MSRITDRLLVLVYVALAALPIMAMRMGCKDRELHGSLPPAPLPEMTLSGVLSEDVQHGIAAWFESNLGFKGTSISLDNALLYHVFGETKPGAGVRLGKDHVLFSNEDLDYYNKNGRWITEPAYVEKLADQIADVQRRMRAKHKALVPVLVPAKTSIWRDKAPDAWVMNLPLPRASDETTRMVTQALALRGVIFVDARELFTSSGIPRADLYAPDARHWSSYGACLAMSRVVDARAKLLGEPRLPHHCVFERQRVSRSNDDFDLWRLLNAIWVYPTVKEVPGVHHTRPPAPLAGPALFVATSFGWQIMRDAEDSGLFQSALLNYYNQTFAHAAGGEREPVEAGTARWRELTMGSDLIVLDLFEAYLGSPEAYVQLFLDDMTRELDAHP